MRESILSNKNIALVIRLKLMLAAVHLTIKSKYVFTKSKRDRRSYSSSAYRSDIANVYLEANYVFQ